ncbi:unnamed protein product [Prorocentrum cordatum]|uniref:Uncharacterized protein n=1 Tax=Prorocentrum cordatum TaxID=2364126 RepID=A0ABN9UFQ1_9DINO|nr:unnamed protein product [Polarella glacialis]
MAGFMRNASQFKWYHWVGGITTGVASNALIMAGMGKTYRWYYADSEKSAKDFRARYGMPTEAQRLEVFSWLAPSWDSTIGEVERGSAAERGRNEHVRTARGDVLEAAAAGRWPRRRRSFVVVVVGGVGNGHVDVDGDGGRGDRPLFRGAGERGRGTQLHWRRRGGGDAGGRSPQARGPAVSGPRAPGRRPPAALSGRVLRHSGRDPVPPRQRQGASPFRAVLRRG